MPPTYRVYGWLFPRALAAIYLVAFISWSWQMEALTGEQGIMPVPKFLEIVAQAAEENDFIAWTKVPTVYWLGYSDAMAQWLCWGACAAAVLVMAGVLQAPLLLALWFAYLSICTTGDVFLSFQWDILLLEAGFIAALISPWRLFIGRIRESTPAPSRVQVLLPQALILKLMFLSGLTKIMAGDPNWWPNLTALTYHYETQPIPTWVAWYAHQFPLWFHKTSCLIMFFVELVVPALIIVVWIWEVTAPSWVRSLRALRVFIAASFTGLMMITLITGNYTFFNWLTILLALSVLDDRCWPSFLRRLLRWTEAPPNPPVWMYVAQGVLVTQMLLLSLTMALQENAPWVRFPLRPAFTYIDEIRPFRTINSYGLFRVMTTERNEIVIEVSDDGAYFQPLEFKWKPGLLDRAPPFVAPHQPRLDWQMWFAAFYPGFIPQRDMRNPQIAWFGRLLEELLNHNEKVYALMEPPPFPIQSIHAVRATFYRYEFTDAETRKKTGQWWTATPLGDYSSTVRKR